MSIASLARRLLIMVRDCWWSSKRSGVAQGVIAKNTTFLAAAAARATAAWRTTTGLAIQVAPRDL